MDFAEHAKNYKRICGKVQLPDKQVDFWLKPAMAAALNQSRQAKGKLSCLMLHRDAQHLTGINLVRISQHGLVGFENGTVAIGIAVDCLRDP